MICGWIFTSLVDGIALHLTCTGINACFLCWTFLCKCLIIIRYLGPRLLPPASWQPGPRSCAHLSNPMQELSAHRGIFCLVVLSFSIRSGQSRGQTAISDTLLYWFLVYGAVNHEVKPRSPVKYRRSWMTSIVRLAVRCKGHTRQAPNMPGDSTSTS